MTTTQAHTLGGHILLPCYTQMKSLASFKDAAPTPPRKRSNKTFLHLPMLLINSFITCKGYYLNSQELENYNHIRMLITINLKHLCMRLAFVQLIPPNPNWQPLFIFWYCVGHYHYINCYGLAISYIKLSLVFSHRFSSNLICPEVLF